VNLFTSSSEQFSRIFLFLFFVVIALFMTITEAVFRLRVAGSHPFELYKEMYSRQSAEVVMFGDSHVVNGIVTTSEVLNLGYAGNNMNSMTTKALDYAENNDIEYIGLQADPHLFSYYRIVKNQYDHLDSLLNKNEKILYMYKPHLRKYLLDYWKSWLSDPMKIFFPEKEKRNANSEIEVHSIVEVDNDDRKKQASIRVQLHRPIDSFEKSESAMQFINAIQELSDSGKKICLISYPVSSDYRAASKTYVQFSKVVSFYRSLSKIKNIKYINYADRYEDSYFADVDHLNLNGRTKFTREVINECFDILI